MFNQVAWKQLQQILHLCHPHLLPLLDSLYQDANCVDFKCAAGTFDLICQDEGNVQGCPLSSVFTSLTIGDILIDLNKNLANSLTKIPKQI
jgi:hypothetical protein